IADSTAAGFETSTFVNSAVPPAFEIASQVELPAASSQSMIDTAPPRSASKVHAACPMPKAPPVTTMVLPSNLISPPQTRRRMRPLQLPIHHNHRPRVPVEDACTK